MKGLKRSKEVGEAFRELGYRLTPQRQLILTALQQSDDHISAEDIHARVCIKYPQVNISTVYRTLELLKGLGLVTETDLGSGRFRYHPAEKGHHHHLICEQCGATIDVDESLFLPIKHTVFREYGFRANISHFAIFGRCARCRR
ncbi:MAG: Fur family transcriptional regulator [Dehalococcoidia bacterium DG_18]|nr:MAG: Fur family transcriptional regulator [Dehalococcoidia bacterium DG_18]